MGHGTSEHLSQSAYQVKPPKLQHYQLLYVKQSFLRLVQQRRDGSRGRHAKESIESSRGADWFPFSDLSLKRLEIFPNKLERVGAEEQMRGWVFRLNELEHRPGGLDGIARLLAVPGGTGGAKGFKKRIIVWDVARGPHHGTARPVGAKH